MNKTKSESVTVENYQLNECDLQGTTIHWGGCFLLEAI